MRQETRRIFFWNFLKKNKAHRDSDSKNRGIFSKNTRKAERKKQRPTGIKPKTHAAGGSGSSGCLRGVGSIRIP